MQPLKLTVEIAKRAFMSIMLLLGVIRVPYYRMHWEAATRYPQIADKMGRQRFDIIKRFLHFFNDNSRAIKPQKLRTFDIAIQDSTCPGSHSLPCAIIKSVPNIFIFQLT